MTTQTHNSIAAIRSVLERDPRIRLAIVFGSLAAGRARPESDADVAVLADRPLSAELKMEWIGVLAAATGRPVDLIDLRTAGEPLLGQILKGRRLVGDAALHGEWIAWHLVEQADFLPYRRRILMERRRAWIGR